MPLKDPEAQKKYHREYRQNHLEYFREYDRNRIRDPEKQKLWRQHEKERLTPEKTMWTAAKHRAKAKGLDFDIDISDIIIPKLCPILGIPLQINVGTFGPRYSSPTLDRIDNTRGYVKGNVAVISHKANACKSDLTKEQIRSLARYID